MIGGRRPVATMSISDLLMAIDSLGQAVKDMREGVVDAGTLDHVRMAGRLVGDVERKHTKRRAA